MPVGLQLQQYQPLPSGFPTKNTQMNYVCMDTHEMNKSVVSNGVYSFHTPEQALVQRTLLFFSDHYPYKWFPMFSLFPPVVVLYQLVVYVTYHMYCICNIPRMLKHRAIC